jgi:hypothetical protein
MAGVGDALRSRTLPGASWVPVNVADQILMLARMSSSMCLKRKHIADGHIRTGMIKSRLLPACKLDASFPSASELSDGPRYLVSLAYHRIWRLATCSTLSLRNTNVLAILQLALVASLCRKTIEAILAEQKPGTSGPQSISVYALHSAFNIALFPVLFFFSALYYTDIVSTLFVLLAYQNHLSRVGPVGVPSIFNDLWTIILGVASLMMRQTNIFWVVVYMGGAEAVHAVEQLKPVRDGTPRFATLLAVARHYGWRYSLADVHDPPISYAGIEGELCRPLLAILVANCP